MTTRGRLIWKGKPYVMLTYGLISLHYILKNCLACGRLPINAASQLSELETRPKVCCTNALDSHHVDGSK